jgi:hypothetical protein
MKLTYRGVSYEYTPNQVPTRGSTIGTGVYRGADITFNALEEVPAQPQADLAWRGVSYHTGTAEPVVAPVRAEEQPATPVAKISNGVTALARNLCIQHHQRIRRREQGMMVRLAAEVGLPVEEAAHYTSGIQGKLPHGFSGYDRSSTAMS